MSQSTSVTSDELFDIHMPEVYNDIIDNVDEMAGQHDLAGEDM